MKLPKIILKAVSEFTRLQGVGEKTALRQVLQMSNWTPERIEGLGQSILGLKNINHCAICGAFAEVNTCDICTSEKRKSSKTLCVVENISDCMAIENSEQFGGVYHILGGVLNPLMGVGPDQLNIDKLVSRVNKEKIENIILAVNPSVDGDATCSYLKQLFSETINVERIGFGIPMGGSLEYLDPMTISKALENRKRF